MLSTEYSYDDGGKWMGKSGPVCNVAEANQAGNGWSWARDFYLSTQG